MKYAVSFSCVASKLSVGITPTANGRFIEVTQADLKCTLCKNGDVGDEYHYLCVCVFLI